jgi:thiol-disulfide isomerase/thioredoxin
MNKSIILISLVMLLGFSACSPKKAATTTTPAVEETKPATVNFSEQSTWLLGYFNRSQMSGEPHSAWFLKGYDAYQPSQDAVNKLTELGKSDITIKIVLGTWCPDSRREVPRFMRILDIWTFPAEKVTFIGVDNFKNGPVGEFQSLKIERVPTFIIYKNNIEAGRIIENPVTSLEQDMVNILTGTKSN